MTSPFTDERGRIEQALTFDTGCEPSAQEIIDALNRAGYQITPQAGEPVAWASAKEFAMLANGNTAMVSARRTLSGDVPLYRTAPPPDSPGAGGL